jgi:hypothetical protein
MQTLRFLETVTPAELARVERQVLEINDQINRQRELIEWLQTQGDDATSEKITLDSLLISLFLHAEHRTWLRAKLDGQEGQHLQTRSGGTRPNRGELSPRLSLRPRFPALRLVVKK